MANTTSPMGHQSTLSIGGVSYPYVSETLAKTGQHLERVGIRGTRSHDVDDVREGPYRVAGAITIEPTSAELLTLVRIAMGGNTLAEALTEYAIIVDRVGAVFTYAGCKFGKMTVSGSQGGVLTAVLDVVGKTESVSGSEPSEPTSVKPLIFADATLNLATAARETNSFTLIIDNALVEGLFRNNLTVQDIPEGDRIITLSTQHPLTSAISSALYGQAVAGAAGNLAINDGSLLTTFAFTKLQVPDKSPGVAGKGEIMLDLDMVSRKDGATLELVVTQA